MRVVQGLAVRGLGVCRVPLTGPPVKYYEPATEPTCEPEADLEVLEES